MKNKIKISKKSEPYNLLNILVSLTTIILLGMMYVLVKRSRVDDLYALLAVCGILALFIGARIYLRHAFTDSRLSMRFVGDTRLEMNFRIREGQTGEIKEVDISIDENSFGQMTIKDEEGIVEFKFLDEKKEPSTLVLRLGRSYQVSGLIKKLKLWEQNCIRKQNDDKKGV